MITGRICASALIQPKERRWVIKDKTSVQSRLFDEDGAESNVPMSAIISFQIGDIIAARDGQQGAGDTTETMKTT